MNTITCDREKLTPLKNWPFNTNFAESNFLRMHKYDFYSEIFRATVVYQNVLLIKKPCLDDSGISSSNCGISFSVFLFFYSTIFVCLLFVVYFTDYCYHMLWWIKIISGGPALGLDIKLRGWCTSNVVVAYKVCVEGQVQKWHLSLYCRVTCIEQRSYDRP